MNLRDVIPTAENSSNFNVVPESITEVGTTLENLKAAVCGETGASAKYAACAAAAGTWSWRPFCFCRPLSCPSCWGRCCKARFPPETFDAAGKRACQGAKKVI